MRILVMGLSGAGKTTYAKKLAKLLECPHFNADEIRKQHNDWDFSNEGRMRQARRMQEISKDEKVCILDFICPTPEVREVIRADLVIWLDRTKKSQYKDTDQIFVPPNYDVRIKEDKNESNNLF